MKTTDFVRALLIAGLLTAFNVSGHPAPAQAAKSVGQKTAPGARLTNQQAASLNLAWRNLARAYQDLMTVAPDVKGDTAKLEGALRAAIHDLHQMDPALAEASGLQGQDRGQKREAVFDAVQKHLDLGKKYIEDAKINSPSAEHALGQIAIAYAELKVDRTASVK